jgi:hypothetical protein
MPKQRARAQHSNFNFVLVLHTRFQPGGNGSMSINRHSTELDKPALGLIRSKSQVT